MEKSFFLSFCQSICPSIFSTLDEWFSRIIKRETLNNRQLGLGLRIHVFNIINYDNGKSDFRRKQPGVLSLRCSDIQTALFSFSSPPEHDIFGLLTAQISNLSTAAVMLPLHCTIMLLFCHFMFSVFLLMAMYG